VHYIKYNNYSIWTTVALDGSIYLIYSWYCNMTVTFLIKTQNDLIVITSYPHLL